MGISRYFKDADKEFKIKKINEENINKFLESYIRGVKVNQVLLLYVNRKNQLPNDGFYHHVIKQEIKFLFSETFIVKLGTDSWSKIICDISYINTANVEVPFYTFKINPDSYMFEEVSSGISSTKINYKEDIKKLRKVLNRFFK